MNALTRSKQARRASGIAMAFAALLALGCKGGGTDDCPQCNSHCRLPAWPRLIVSVTDGAAPAPITPLTVRMSTDNYTSSFGMGIDGGAGQYCACLDHLTDVACTEAYVLGPAQRNVTLDVWRGDALLGSCQLYLPEHNYCGFNATALAISVTDQQQIVCGSPRTLDICPR
jgi:hypothetical protein